MGSSQEQWGAVGSSQEQSGAVGSSREQSGAVTSSGEQSGAVTWVQDLNPNVRTTRESGCSAPRVLRLVPGLE